MKSIYTNYYKQEMYTSYENYILFNLLFCFFSGCSFSYNFSYIIYF